MTTFMCFLKWTEQGAKNLKDIGKRSQAAKDLAQKLGGSITSAYITTGQYDVVVTLDMPDPDAMVKFSIALSTAGNVRTTTSRAFGLEEFTRLANEAPSM